MHKKILLCLNRNQFEPFDYSISFDEAMMSLGFNSGNNIFQYSLQKMLTNDKNEITIDTKFIINSYKFLGQEYFDSINNNYDALVFSPANTIALFARFTLKSWTENISKITIPVYAIGLGAQSDYDFDKTFLLEIQSESKKFITSILNTGGFIGTRGYFSSLCLESLGFIEGKDFMTIGCPSIFLKGRRLQVEKQKLNKEDLKIAFNGFTLWNMEKENHFLEKYSNSFFVCQDEFYRLLYEIDELTWKEIQYLYDTSNTFLNAYLKNQIRLYGDFDSWANDLVKNGINFSFGCRIHGNIMPILNGIPAFTDSIDSRIRELSDYFNIPSKHFDHKFPDIYELYEQMDYSLFNKEFSDKYDIFKGFMDKCGLHIEPSNQLKSLEYSTPTEQDKQKLIVHAERYTKPLVELGNRHQELGNRHQELENKYQELGNKYQELGNRHQELENRHQELENKYQEFINKIAWWIPVQKWRDKFISKFN